MSYYDVSDEERKRLESVGADSDLLSCLYYNKQEGFTAPDIKKVWAVWEGENDGEDWRWVLELKDKRFVFLQGGCDYTGWDCQSWATSDFATTALKAAKFALGDVQLTGKSPYEAGMGHMLNILSGHYGDNFKLVYEDLVKQIKTAKKETWRERTKKDLGL